MTAQRDKKYIAAADLLRVVSVGLVAWFHFWQQNWIDPGFHIFGLWVDMARIVRRGYMMVDLMLLLSGFLLYLPEARRAVRGQPWSDTGDYFLRRARRILPSYWFALFVAAVLCMLMGPLPGSPPLWKDLLTHLTFTQTFTRPTYVWTNLNGVLWTLAVEVQFYLLFPLLGRLFRRFPVPTWAGMTVFALGCRYAVSQAADPTMYFNQLPCMLDLYAFGMLTAHLLARTEGAKRHWLYGLGSLAALWGILWILWIQDPANGRELQILQIVWRLPLAVLGSIFLFCGGRWSRGLSRAVGNPAIRFLAGISYNFYIWHQYLAVRLKDWHIPPYTARELPQMTEGIAWQRRYDLCCWIAAFLAAILTTYLLERPLSRLGGRSRRAANRLSGGNSHG